MVLMIMSGWQIYNARRFRLPLFEFDHAWRLARRRAALALCRDVDLMVNGLIYLALGFATGASARSCCRLRRRAYRGYQGRADRKLSHEI